jgi:hypothetical protein
MFAVSDQRAALDELWPWVTTIQTAFLRFYIYRISLSCFEFDKSRVQISARRLDILTEVFCGFYNSFQGNAGLVPLIRPRMLPSTSFLIHHSLILPFDGIIVWVIDKASLNKRNINKYNSIGCSTDKSGCLLWWCTVSWNWAIFERCLLPPSPRW